MSQLSESRNLLAATVADADDARLHYAELAAQLSAARQRAQDARSAGDVRGLAEATADVGALAVMVEDAGGVLRERQRTVEDAGRAVDAIEEAAANLRRQVDALAGELDNPRNEYAKRVWAAEATLSQAEHGLARAKREQEDAAAQLGELRGRLASLAG